MSRACGPGREGKGGRAIGDRCVANHVESRRCVLAAHPEQLRWSELSIPRRTAARDCPPNCGPKAARRPPWRLRPVRRCRERPHPRAARVPTQSPRHVWLERERGDEHGPLRGGRGAGLREVVPTDALVALESLAEHLRGVAVAAGQAARRAEEIGRRRKGGDVRSEEPDLGKDAQTEDA